MTKPKTTTEIVSEIEGLFEKATPVDWCAQRRPSEGISPGRTELRSPEHGCIAFMSFPDIGEDRANAALIVALVNHWPAIKEALCEWRPIAEWDEMKPKDRPQRALFWFKASESGGARLAPTIKEGRFYGYRECTHFMPIEPPTQGGEHE